MKLIIKEGRVMITTRMGLEGIILETSTIVFRTGTPLNVITLLCLLLLKLVQITLQEEGTCHSVGTIMVILMLVITGRGCIILRPREGVALKGLMEVIWIILGLGPSMSTILRTIEGGIMGRRNLMWIEGEGLLERIIYGGECLIKISLIEEETGYTDIYIYYSLRKK
jgi:hypothetical protein